MLSIFFLQQIETDYNFKYEHSVLGLLKPPRRACRQTTVVSVLKRHMYCCVLGHEYSLLPGVWTTYVYL